MPTLDQIVEFFEALQPGITFVGALFILAGLLVLMRTANPLQFGRPALTLIPLGVVIGAVHPLMLGLDAAMKDFVV